MKKSIKKNFLYDMSFQILNIFIPLFTVPYLSRVLGADGLGISGFTFSVVSIFILLGNIGVSTYGQKEIAAHRKNIKRRNQIFWEIFCLKFLANIAVIILYLFFIFIVKSNQSIYIILILNILASTIDISWFFQGLEEYRFLSIRNIIFKIIFTVSMFFFIKSANDLPLYVLLNCLSLLANDVVLWLKALKMVEIKPPKKLHLKKNMNQTFPYFNSQIAAQLLSVSGSIMLGIIISSNTENGYYSQVNKFLNVSLLIITSLNTILMPRMAYLHHLKKEKEIRKRLNTSIQLVIFLSIAMMFGIAAITTNFVPWFFGADFASIGGLLIISSPCIVLKGINDCLENQYLIPCNRRQESLRVLWLAVIINVILNIFLIPFFKSYGVIISLLITEVIKFVMFFKLTQEQITVNYAFFEVWKNLLAGGVMYLLIRCISNFLFPSAQNTVLEVLIGIISYTSLLVMLKEKFVTRLIKKKVDSWIK